VRLLHAEIMAALGLLAEHDGRALTRAAVLEGLESQCRCGCYPHIVAAGLDAAVAGRPRADS
jgi:aerobic-type carbon monoxide dehydrogenase small subunit (CoxS/CutS family)